MRSGTRSGRPPAVVEATCGCPLDSALGARLTPRLLYTDMPDGAETSTIEAAIPGTVAVAVHRGPYDELGVAYREVHAWVERQGRRTNGALFDVCRNYPAITAPADLETEVCWPIT